MPLSALGWSGRPALAPMKALDELVVGLVGIGRIGRATAEMLSGLVGGDRSRTTLPHHPFPKESSPSLS